MTSWPSSQHPNLTAFHVINICLYQDKQKTNAAAEVTLVYFFFIYNDSNIWLDSVPTD